MRTVHPMQDTTTEGLDLEVFAREHAALYGRICDLDLPGRGEARSTRLQSYSSVLETIAQKLPGKDPLLLCWRVWAKERKRALASHNLWYEGPREGSLAHRAMGLRLCVYWTGHPREYQLHRSLLPENRTKGSGQSYAMLSETTAWERWYNRAGE